MLLKYKLSDMKHRILQLENLNEHKNYFTSIIQRDLTELIFPDWMNLTTIGQMSFSNFTSLTSVTIPDTVTTINYSAFSSCTNLTDMYLYPITPPTLRNTMAISTATTAIHVPIGSGDAYRTATNWSTFADIIVEDIEI